jgi:hypothetical protein
MHTARLLRPLAVAASVAALAMFAAAPAGAAASSPSPTKVVHTHPIMLVPGASTTGSTVDSFNWAGYATLPAHSGASFRFVKSTFTVPSVNCSTTPSSFSVHWVGLDGINEGANGTVEQDGVESDCSGSTPAYTAWWETFPGNTIQTAFTLNAGDAVTASVYFNTGSSHHDMYNIVLKDVTSGHGFNLWESCGASSGHKCLNASAEVISEAPSSTTGILPLADYGIMNYVNIGVTDKSGQKGGITSSNWKDDEIIQVSQPKGTATLATPGSLFGSQAFSNTWKQES